MPRHFHFARYNSFSSAICVVLQWDKISYTEHCMKSVQTWSCFWSVFSRILTEYGEILSPNAGKYRPEKTSYLETFHEVKLLLNFFLMLLDFLRILWTSISSSQQNIKTNFILNASSILSELFAGPCFLCVNSFAHIFVAYVSTHLLFCIYSVNSSSTPCFILYFEVIT